MTHLPATYDLVWSVVALTALALLASALVAWSRARETSLASLLWFVVMVAIPLLGPLAYLLDRRRRRRLDATD